MHVCRAGTAFLPGATLDFRARTVPDGVAVKQWEWAVEAAPTGGKVTFGTSDAAATTAEFTVEGVYTVSATADGHVGTLVVEVYDTATDNTTRAFGYSLETLIEFFTGDAHLPVDPAAVAALRANPSITAMPPPGVHPRVLFSSADLPDIRCAEDVTFAFQPISCFVFCFLQFVTCGEIQKKHMPTVYLV